MLLRETVFVGDLEPTGSDSDASPPPPAILTSDNVERKCSTRRRAAGSDAKGENRHWRVTPGAPCVRLGRAWLAERGGADSDGTLAGARDALLARPTRSLLAVGAALRHAACSP